jgi:hypothetical protein
VPWNVISIKAKLAPSLAALQQNIIKENTSQKMKLGDVIKTPTKVECASA